MLALAQHFETGKVLLLIVTVYIKLVGLGASEGLLSLPPILPKGHQGYRHMSVSMWAL